MIATITEKMKTARDMLIDSQTMDLTPAKRQEIAFEAMRLMMEAVLNKRITYGHWKELAAQVFGTHEYDAAILYTDNDGIECGTVYGCPEDAAVEIVYSNDETSYRMVGVSWKSKEFIDLDLELERAIEDKQREAEQDEKYSSPAAMRSWYHSKVL